MVTGCAQVARVPSPTSAREFHVAQGQRRGVGLVLDFATPAQASQWVTALRGQLAACPTSPSNGVPGVRRVRSDTSGWLGRRDYGGGQQWAEIVVLSGRSVRLWILQDPNGQISDAELRTLATTVSS